MPKYLNPKFLSPKFIPTPSSEQEPVDDRLKFNPINSVVFKDTDNENVAISNAEAQQIITDFLINEIGKFIEFGFKEERLNLEKRIEEHIVKLREGVTAKLDSVCEEVVRDLKSNAIKEEIVKGVEEKLNKLKELL